MIIEVGERNGRFFTIDRRLSGRSFSEWLRQADVADRRQALISFLDATERLCRLPSPVPGFARLVGPAAPQQFGSLGALLHSMLAGPTQASRQQLESDLPSVAQVWDRLHADLAQRQVLPALVHGDVCAPNSYLSMGPSGPVVTGIGDFSPHTVNGDPMMDITGAVAFLELEPYAEAAQDSSLARGGRRGAPRSGHGALDRRLSPLLRVLLLQLPRVRSRRSTVGACGN